MIAQRDTYKFCTNCKGKLVDKGNAKQCPDCQKQYFFNAQPTVTGVIVNSQGEVLLTKRGRDPFKGWWDVPGGFVEPGESLEQAIQREMKEELGITAENVTYLASVPDDYHLNDEIIPVFNAFFLVRLKNDQNIAVGDDVVGYQFFPVKEVDFDKIAFDNQRKLFKEIIESKLS